MTKETSHTRNGRVYRTGTSAWLGKNLIEFFENRTSETLDEYLIRNQQFTSLYVESTWWAPDEAWIQDKRVASLDVYITAVPTDSKELIKLYM